MRKLFKYIIYLSLIFLIYYLYKFDYLIFNDFVIDKFYMFLATLFLWGGFFFSGLSWWNALRVHKINVPKKKVIISHGLSIFAKYIPGKVWTILGRASFISSDDFLTHKTTFISFKEQLLYLWFGLIIGIIPLVYYYPLNAKVIFVLLITFIITFFLFSPKCHDILIKIANRIFKKEFDIPVISYREMISMILWVMLYWLLWLIAFYLFVLSFQKDSPIQAVFCWPLGITIGLLSIIIPGGIGVREGVMIGFMVLTGIKLEAATTIAVSSRLWFISGEFFIFFLSLFMNRFRLKSFNR